MKGFRRVWETRSMPEAGFVRMLLDREGMETRLENEALAGLTGEIPFAQASIEVWVEEARFDEALELVTRHKERIDSTEPEAQKACGACQAQNPETFEICWSCGKPLEPPTV